jgi:hypothetical protein
MLSQTLEIKMQKKPGESMKGTSRWETVASQQVAELRVRYLMKMTEVNNSNIIV